MKSRVDFSSQSAERNRIQSMKDLWFAVLTVAILCWSFALPWTIFVWSFSALHCKLTTKRWPYLEDLFWLPVQLPLMGVLWGWELARKLLR
jgi:hypothetical protein